MNLLTNILNSKSYWTKCSSALCGIAMAEMGVRTIVDITKNKKDDLSADLSGAIFFAICASNIVPGFARGGSIAFVCYSIGADTSKNNAYWSSKVVSFPFEKTWEGLKFIGTHLDIVNHPTWFGVAALITIIGLYTLGKHIFEQPKVLAPPPVHTSPQIDTTKLA